MFRNLRAFLSLRRLPLRAETYLSSPGATHNVQRVRFLRPLLTKKRALRALLYTAPVVGFWHFILPAVLPDDDDEEETGNEQKQLTVADLSSRNGGVGGPATSAGAEQEWPAHLAVEVADEDATFIPLGWARQCPQQPYKGTDPEWQEFVNFSRDEERGAQVRHELAGLVGDTVSSQKAFSHICGTPVNVYKYWLDIDFPYAPPPEFERSGIEITDDYVAWTTRPVSARNYFRVRQALWPTSVSSSIWASYTALFHHNVAKIREVIGFKSDGKEQAYPVDSPMLPRASAKRSEARPDLPADGTLTESSTDSLTADAASKPTSDKPSSSGPKQDVLPPLPAVPQLGANTSTAITAFKKNLARTWRPALDYPPRGTFYVSGLVEVVGPKAMAVIDVRASYNPKSSQWEEMVLGVRRLRKRKQVPLG